MPVQILVRKIEANFAGELICYRSFAFSNHGHTTVTFGCAQPLGNATTLLFTFVGAKIANEIGSGAFVAFRSYLAFLSMHGERKSVCETRCFF